VFTGIIETLGEVMNVEKSGTNRMFTIASSFSNELSIDQSVAHDGVCLTVVHRQGNTHQVVAVQETLEKSTLRDWGKGHTVNLERSMTMEGRLDGHLVQGHVDGLGICKMIEQRAGSWIYTFSYPLVNRNLLVSKGSICVNGVSLTVIDPSDDTFQVTIIPYTYDHTNFQNLSVGDAVNLEFDILGKYVQRMMQPHQ